MNTTTEGTNELNELLARATQLEQQVVDMERKTNEMQEKVSKLVFENKDLREKNKNMENDMYETILAGIPYQYLIKHIKDNHDTDSIFDMFDLDENTVLENMETEFIIDHLRMNVNDGLKKLVNRVGKDDILDYIDITVEDIQDHCDIDEICRQYLDDLSPSNFKDFITSL